VSGLVHVSQINKQEGGMIGIHLLLNRNPCLLV
jgi:hypothetical protein